RDAESGDVEAGRRGGERGAEHVVQPLRRDPDRQPALSDLRRELDVPRADRGEVDRDLRAKRPGHQLQRPVVAERDLVVLAVVLERLAAEGSADDLDVLPGAPERLAERLAVPAL